MFSIKPLFIPVVFFFSIKQNSTRESAFHSNLSQIFFVMLQGIAQTFIVRLPMSYFMSMRPGASLTEIGLAAPCATVFGIVLNVVFYLYFTKKEHIRDKKSL